LTDTSDRRAAHKAKMARKAAARLKLYAANGNQPLRHLYHRVMGTLVVAKHNWPASINRHTGEPHEHRAEIARRLGAA
jgi:hypothetical protein